MSNRVLRTPLIVVAALLVGGASAFGMPYVPHTPPSVTITSKPTAWSNVAGPTFKWSKSGTINSTTCQIDGGSFTACTTSKTYSGLAAGSHTFAAKVTGPGGTTTKNLRLADRPDRSGRPDRRHRRLAVVAEHERDAERVRRDRRREWPQGLPVPDVHGRRHHLGHPATAPRHGQRRRARRSRSSGRSTCEQLSAWFPAVADATNTVSIDKTLPTAPTVSGGGAATAWQNVASLTIDAVRLDGCRRPAGFSQVSGALLDQRRPHLRLPSLTRPT